MGVYIWNRLPSEYQEVEYIKSPTTGTYPSTGPYLNTGYIPTINTKIELQYMYDNSASGNFPIYGTWQNKSGNTRFNGWYINTDGITFGAGNQNGANGYISAPANTLATVQHYISNSTLYNVVNGTTKTTSSVSFTGASNSIYIFARNNSSSTIECGGGRIYYFRIYESGVLLRNFIPCYRKSDSVIGMYELITNQFYTNSGTGTFTKGSAVNNYYEKEMKNAYIGEVWTPNANTLAYYPLAEDGLDKTGHYTLSNTGTAQTLGRRFTAQASLNSTPSNPRTTSGWVKIASASASGGQCGVLGIGGSYICYGTDNSKVYNKSLYIYASANYYYSINLIDNQWHHIVLTNNGSNIIGYVDGVAHSLGNPSIPNFGNNLVYCSGSNTIDVTLSEVILENKQWTQSEVSHYFDITKSTYGL